MKASRRIIITSLVLACLMVLLGFKGAYGTNTEYYLPNPPSWASVAAFYGAEA